MVGELYLCEEVTFSLETDRPIFVKRYAPEAEIRTPLGTENKLRASSYLLS
jgi:hypothetical protein